MAGRKSHRARARRRNRTGAATPAAPRPPTIEFTEQERPELPGPATPPYALVHKLLSAAARDKARAVNTVREESRAEVEEHHRRYTEIATGVAAALHELRQLLGRDSEHLREAGFADQADTLTALDRRIVAALTNAGVRVVDPLGESYLAVADHISVKHRPADIEDADLIVAETVRPGVLLDDGELVRPAQVFLEADAGRVRAQEGTEAGAAAEKAAESGAGAAKAETAEAAEAAERPRAEGDGIEAADTDRHDPEAAAAQSADTEDMRDNGGQPEKTGTEEGVS